MVSKVTWNNIVNVKYIYDNKETESIDKIRDNLHFCLFKSSNIHGDNFMSTFSMYQNHVDLSICRAYDLTLDGNEINESNVEVVGDFLHIKILLYSFVGKKKNKKLIYNSLTEYEIWGIKNKNEHYLFFLEKNENKKVEVKLGNENNKEIYPPKDYLEAEIMYSQSPLITSLLKIQIRDNKLYINIKFNDIFSKLYSTNYCNMHINLFKG